jgi:hypothetical protein
VEEKKLTAKDWLFVMMREGEDFPLKYREYFSFT